MLDVTSAKGRLGILFAPVDQLDKDIRHCPPVATLLLDQYEENHIDGLASMSLSGLLLMSLSACAKVAILCLITFTSLCVTQRKIDNESKI